MYVFLAGDVEPAHSGMYDSGERPEPSWESRGGGVRGTW